MPAKKCTHVDPPRNKNNACALCRKALRAAQRAANPDKIRAQGRAAALRRRARDPEKIRKLRRQWDAANPEKVRAYSLASRYGLTHFEFDVRCVAQNNACAICRASFAETKPCVDHDHGTGEVRGILCHNCNRMLGLAKDDEQTLQRAIEYLAAYRSGKLRVIK